VVAGPRFVLRYGGDGPKPEADVERVRALADSVVVESSSRMLLVEAPPGPLSDLVASMTDWVMAPEQTLAVPDTRQRVERPPE